MPADAPLSKPNRPGRDLRVDFFRGLALWWIFVDHIGTDALGQVSLRNFALCDATEVFVLLAGYAAGIAYGRKMDQHGWPFAAAHVIRRAWTLYVAHIFLFVVFTAQVGYSADALNRADYLDDVHVSALGDDPYRALFEALTLHYQPSYLNILPLYITLLLFWIPGLLLLRRPVWLAAVSVALYATARLAGWNFPSWTGGSWYFNPLTWQLLFALGAILSYAPGKPPQRPRLLDAVAGMVVAFGFVDEWIILHHAEWGGQMPRALAHLLIEIDKEGLHPFRLVSILSLAWLVMRLIPAGAAWLRGRWAGPFVVCGQHSLPVFCTGIFLSFLGRLTFERVDGFWPQVAVNGAGALILYAVGATSSWYGGKRRVGGSA